MEKQRFKGQRSGRGAALAVADSAAQKRTGYRLWIMLGVLLVLVAGTWYFGGLATYPRARARQSLAARDFAGAWSWLSVAHRLSRRDPANALLAASVARLQGDAERLEVELAKSKHWGAEPQAVRREQLLALAQAGQLEGIEAELVGMLPDAGQEAAQISEAYANGLAMVARFEDAMSVLDAWRQDFPDDPRPDYRLGRIQEHQQQYEDAGASYRQALAKDGEHFPSRFSLGRVLLGQRRVEEAAAEFRGCLAMPFPEAAQIELAVALKALGQADQARPLLQAALAADEARRRASYLALDEQPEGFKAAAEYGKLEADAGNFAQAEPWLVAALEANPRDLMARYALALTLRGLGRAAEADEHFDRVSKARAAMDGAAALNAKIGRNAADVQSRYLLGRLILEHESERSGLYWLRSVLSYDPNHGPTHALLADYYAQRRSRDASFAGPAEYHRRKAQAAKKVEPGPQTQ